MDYEKKIVDRQVGRNAQLFAQAIANLEDEAARLPYLRILISLLEQAHPELAYSAEKPAKIAHVLQRLSANALSEEEISNVVRARDEERGLTHA